MFLLSALDSLVPEQRVQTRPSSDCFLFFSKGTKGDWISAWRPFVIISYHVNHVKFGKFPSLLLLGGCSFVLAFPIGALGNHHTAIGCS
jgi:hypothetical protein